MQVPTTPIPVSLDFNSFIVQFFGFLALITTQMITMWRNERAADRAAKVLAVETEKAKQEVNAVLHQVGEEQKISASAFASALEQQNNNVMAISKTLHLVGADVANQINANEHFENFDEQVLTKTNKLIQMVEEASEITAAGAEHAEQAYQEVSQVNQWRQGVDKRIDKLGESIQIIVGSIEDILKQAEIRRVSVETRFESLNSSVNTIATSIDKLMTQTEALANASARSKPQ